MTQTKKQADELLRKHARPKVLFTRSTRQPSSAREEVLRQKEDAHQKIQNSRQEDERACRELRTRQRQELVVAKVELERRLLLKSKMGDRVRGVAGDRVASARVVWENKENTRRIEELKQIIKKLESR